MELKREWVESLIFGDDIARRFTQDSPILPDVWLGYALAPGKPMDLLFSPHRDATTGQLASELTRRLEAEAIHPQSTQESRNSPDAESARVQLAYNQSTIVVRFTLNDLVRVALPLTPWWETHIGNQGADYLERVCDGLAESPYLTEIFHPLRPLHDEVQSPVMAESSEGGSSRSDILREMKVPLEIIWLIRLVGTLAEATRREARTKRARPTERQRNDAWEGLQSSPKRIILAAREVLANLPTKDVSELGNSASPLRSSPETGSGSTSPLWSISRNRRASVSVNRSTQAVKADAASRLFNVSCKGISWAIIDSGIDARHPAFRLRKSDSKPYETPFEYDRRGGCINRTRIRATYDFTILRDLINIATTGPEFTVASAGLPAPAEPAKQAELRQRIRKSYRLSDTLRELERGLRLGRDIDWTLLIPFLEVPHDDDYQAPVHDHGTHVAGILGADWQGHVTNEGSKMRGVCPDLYLYDLRVLNREGEGDEFTVMAALQFLRHLNAHKDSVSVHGANLSLSIPHDVANYACGRTPVCEECERLVNSGTVVVAAAGNKGYLQYMTSQGQIQEGYLSISITDPGNAEGVITVGSTHRYMPHSYGVSYFSSRGPTGDGRNKPDLVAPGEKIEAPVPNEGVRRLDGTSMAAPHVSGAAAMLMARHRELAGNPVRIKRILCETATDLGRERYFQGHGMVDILRALQSV